MTQSPYFAASVLPTSSTPSFDPDDTSIDPAQSSIYPDAASIDPAQSSIDPDAVSIDPAQSSIDPAAQLEWSHIVGEGLSLSFTRLLSPAESRLLLASLERQIAYPRDAGVRVGGRWHRLPRQQAAFGDPGRVYRFSGSSVPAQPWLPELEALRDRMEAVSGTRFNFVLVNRYRDGDAYIGEHRDAEATLDATAPIASLSLGATREFVLRHADARRSAKASPRRRDVASVRLQLTDGTFWYHSLPRRKRCKALRVSLTFRRLL